MKLVSPVPRHASLLLWLPLAAALTLGGANVAYAEQPSTPAAAAAQPGPTGTLTGGPPGAANATLVEAERLFKEGVARMDAGDFASACPSLERSHALDPSSGTLLNLGDCYEHLGRTASAWSAFSRAREHASTAGRRDRAEVAEVRRQQLEPRLRRLKVTPPGNLAAPLQLTLDDEPLPASMWNSALPVDPGPHRLRASAPGYADYAVELAAPDPGATALVRIPELSPIEPASASESESSHASGLSEARIAAIACGAVGVLGVASGTIFGLRSASKHEQSDEYCSGRVCREQRGVDLMDSARRAGNISTVSFVVGGLGLGAAAVLWFGYSDEARSSARAEVGVAPGSLQIRGRW